MSLFVFEQRNYLQRNAFAGRAGERGEPLDGPARDEGLVAPVDLGHGLLDQRNPQLIPFRLKIVQVWCC